MYVPRVTNVLHIIIIYLFYFSSIKSRQANTIQEKIGSPGTNVYPATVFGKFLIKKNSFLGRFHPISFPNDDPGVV
jgi:hypothetical protein